MFIHISFSSSNYFLGFLTDSESDESNYASKSGSDPDTLYYKPPRSGDRSETHQEPGKRGLPGQQNVAVTVR